MLLEVLGSVLVELKEAGRVVLNISIAEIVKLITELVLYIFLELRGVLALVDVELASGRLKFVGLSSLATLGDDLIDAALDVGASKVLSLKKEGHKAHQGLLGRSNEILVTHDIERLSLLDIAVLDHGLEELLLLISLSLDEPRPPLRVVN